jgi:hypothetical protein
MQKHQYELCPAAELFSQTEDMLKFHKHRLKQIIRKETLKKMCDYARWDQVLYSVMVYEFPFYVHACQVRYMG